MLQYPYNEMQYVRSDYSILNERTEVMFNHGKLKLAGYLYETNNPLGLVICAHGVNSFADGDNAQLQSYFLSEGWNVFSFDMIGCGNSEGDGLQGLYESRFCVNSAINYVKSVESLKNLSICLVGHSFGGYGVVTASNDNDVKAVASFSAYNSPAQMMVDSARKYTGFFADFTKPALDLSLRILEGDKAFFKASDVIKKHSETNYYIIHGEDDDVNLIKDGTIYNALKDKDYSNLKIAKLKGVKHNGPWKSLDAINYYEEELYPAYEELEKEYKNNIPQNVKENFYSSIDKARSSELNLELLEDINTMFKNSVN